MSKQKQEDVLEFIEKYIQDYRIAPSVREICEGLNIRSTSTVHRYLHRLEEEDKIHMGSGKKRAIFISDIRSQGIPVIKDVIKPEFTLLEEENIQKYYRFISDRNQFKPLFGFYLKENRSEFGFLKGDFLIAEKKQISEESDEITVFLGQDGKPDITSGEVPDGAEMIGIVISMTREFSNRSV